MIRRKLLRAAVCAALLMLGISSASATLIDLGSGLLYDDASKLTWLQDANYPFTTSYSANTGGIPGHLGGKMTWTEASSWAANLNYGGYDDWRLPTIDALRYMYFVNLGLEAWGQSSDGTFHGGVLGNGSQMGGQADVGLVHNLQNYAYWSDTEFPSGPLCNPGPCAMGFWTDAGESDRTGQDSELYAWAVRGPTLSAIPEPETYAMLLAGLGLLGFVACRRKLEEAAVA